LYFPAHPSVAIPQRKRADLRHEQASSLRWAVGRDGSEMVPRWSRNCPPCQRERTMRGHSRAQELMRDMTLNRTALTATCRKEKQTASVQAQSSETSLTVCLFNLMPFCSRSPGTQRTRPMIHRMCGAETLCLETGGLRAAPTFQAPVRMVSHPVRGLVCCWCRAGQLPPRKGAPLGPC
jgi:hypothetical protein